MMETLLLVHAAATWYMVGIIWIVQLVHYPFFQFLPNEGFQAAMVFHQRRISIAVIPGMLLELLSLPALLLLPWGLALILFIALALIWLTTFLVQVPLHHQLLKSRHSETISKLVSSNWIRTGLWSLRGLLLAFGLAYNQLI